MPHKWDVLPLARDCRFVLSISAYVYLQRQVREMINESLGINASWSILFEFFSIGILRLNRYRLLIATALKNSLKI